MRVVPHYGVVLEKNLQDEGGKNQGGKHGGNANPRTSRGTRRGGEVSAHPGNLEEGNETVWGDGRNSLGDTIVSNKEDETIEEGGMEGSSRARVHRALEQVMCERDIA